MRGDDQDERIFATVEYLRSHSGDQWWLHSGACRICSQGWLIAQDTRIHDNYCLKRLSTEELNGILLEDEWPQDFLTFEQVLRAERDAGLTCRFSDPLSPSLKWTVEDLRRERSDITNDEIAYLLAIPSQNVAALTTH
jgi:hypothetical protein